MHVINIKQAMIQSTWAGSENRPWKAKFKSNLPLFILLIHLVLSFARIWIDLLDYLIIK